MKGVDKMFEKIKEYLITVDKFNEPKELKNDDAVSMILLRLILMEKGLIQSHPDMGVDIVRRYRYMYDDKVLRTLEEDIKSQISTYIPQLSSVDVEVDVHEGELLLGIKTPSNNYVFMTNFDQNKVVDLSSLNPERSI